MKENTQKEARRLAELHEEEIAEKDRGVRAMKRQLDAIMGQVGIFTEMRQANVDMKKKISTLREQNDGLVAKLMGMGMGKNDIAAFSYLNHFIHTKKHCFLFLSIACVDN